MCNFYVLRHFRIESHSYLHKRDTKIEICFFQLPGSVTFESWSILKKEKWNDRMVVVNDQSRKLLDYRCIRRGTRIYREVKSVNTLLERRQVTPPSPTSHRIELSTSALTGDKVSFSFSLSPPPLSNSTLLQYTVLLIERFIGDCPLFYFFTVNRRYEGISWPSAGHVVRVPRLSITDQPWIIATAITFFFHPFYLFYSKVSEKKNCSELFFFHESIRDCRGNEDDSSIVSIPFLWNIIIFRKHSKLGNVFRESFTEMIIIFARYGHRQPQVLGNLYEVSQNSPGTSIHGHLSNIGSIPLGSKGITHLSIGVNIDPPLIGTIFDRKPRSSFAIEKSPYASTIVRRFEIYPGDPLSV